MRRLAAFAAVALVTVATVAATTGAQDNGPTCDSVTAEIVGVEGDDVVLEVRVSCPDPVPVPSSTTSTSVPVPSSTPTPSSEPPTTSTSPSTTDVTTTVPPSTTVAPSTTTTSTTTTTTTLPPTTTVPPSTVPTPTTTAPNGGTFTASFDTPSDFFDRFWTYTGNYCTDGTSCRPDGKWPGDHDHSSTETTTCSDPYSSRIVDPNPHSDMIYWCAPGGASTGHIMTALNVSGYAIIGFTPRRSFTDVRRVCFDVNRTDLGGGKWVNVAIVPEAKFLSYPNTNPQAAADGEGPYRLDYVVSNEFAADNGPGDFNIQDLSGIFSVRFFRSLIEPARSGNVIDQENDGFIGNADRATRYRNCITENASTVTITRGGPNGTTSLTIPGQLPTGPVYVIFQDDSYDPDKHDGTGRYTWHFDNILVEAT